MAWVSLVLMLAAIAYTAYLILEHLKEVGVLNAQIIYNRAEIDTVEVDIRTCERERDEAKARVVEVEQTVKDLAMTESEIQSQISARKKEMERRGKFRLDG